MKDVRAEETEDFFPCGKSDPNYRARLRACALLRWTEATRREADRSESGCWEMAQKKTLRSFPSFLHIALRSSCSLALAAGIPMLLDGQTSSLAPAQREEKIGHANAKQLKRLKIKHGDGEFVFKQRSCEIKIKLNKLNIYFYCFCLLYSLIHIIKSFNFLRIK